MRNQLKTRSLFFDKTCPLFCARFITRREAWPLLIVVFFVIVFILTSEPTLGQTRKNETENAYRQLRQSFQQSGVAQSPREAEESRVESVKTWLNRNSWRDLSVKDRVWLCEAITGSDQVDKRSFSARWTGILKVPATGVYTFSQKDVPGGEGKFRLWIEDQLILDRTALEATSNAPEATKKVASEEQDSKLASSSFLSRPVTLVAGKPATFKLEYVREPVAATPGVMRLPGFPAAVLTWQSDVLEEQVVPASAFLTTNESQSAEPGLVGEYYADTSLTKRVVQRIDPNVDFLWDTGRVAGEHRGSQREVVDSALATITSPGFFTTLNAAEAQEFIQKQFPVLLGIMTASERVAVMQVIAEQANLLKWLDFTQMVGALRWYATLPNAESGLSLLIKWSEVSTAPVAQPGFTPGRSPGGYLNVNVEPYFKIARLFSGENMDEKISVLKEHLSNKDGSCNLTLAYVLCCICRIADRPQVMAELIDNHLLGEANESLAGDIRAGWYLAEAFKLETVYSSEFKPGAGLSSIERGLECAESSEMQYRLTGELVARLIALDRSDEAQSLIMSVRDRWPEEAKQEELDRWLAKGEEVTSYYESARVKRSEEADTFTQTAYIQELKRRAGLADARGESRTASRYTGTATDLEKRQADEEKVKKVE